MFDSIQSFFATDAWAMAQAPGGEGGGNPITAFLPLIIIFVLFYFLIIRPQQKRQREAQDMIAALKKGDKVITTGGIYGLVEAVGESTVTIKVAENTRIKFGKQYIISVRGTADED